jgi:PAS domain S-box-containing protein
LNRINHRDGEGYQSIFENAMEGIFQSSIEGRFLKVNPAMARIFGYESPEDLINSISNISKQIYVDEATRTQIIEELAKHEHVEGLETRNYRKDGSIIWTRTNARTVRDENGNLLYFEGILTDITLHKEAEISLLESEEKYRALVERLPGAVFLDSPDDPEKAIYVSPKIEDILGYSQEEWISKVSWSDIIHPEDQGHVLSMSKRTDETGEIFRQEYRMRKKSGDYVWIREETSLVKDEHGEPLFWQGLFLDISDQKQAESAISQSEEQFKKVFQSNPIAALIATLEEERFIAANEAYWKLTGFKPNEFLGRTSIELGFSSSKKRQKLITRLKKEKTIRNESGKLITRSGKIRNTLEFYELISFDERECILAMFYDVTDQVKGQLALKENEEKYRQLFEAESDAIFLIDNESGKILDVNAAASVLYGYSKEELLNKKNTDLSAEAEETRKVTRNTPVNKEHVISIPLRFHRKKDGTIFPVEITGRFFAWRGRPVHIAAIRDITERKRVEEALRESEQNFRNIVEHTTNIYYSHTSDHVLTLMSPQTREILGYEPGEALINWHEFLTDNPVNKEGIELTQKAIDTGERQKTYILELKRKDGQNVWVEVHESPILRNGKTVLIVGALTDITEHKRNEDIFRHQLEDLTILHNIAVAASSSKNLDELIKRATDTIYDTLQPDSCGVELVTGGGDTYYAHPSYRGPSSNQVRKPLPLAKGIIGKVISSGKPVCLGDVSLDPAYIEVTKDIRSELCVPIKIQDRIIGAINIESRQADAYNESDERLLNTIAGTMAAAIEQLRLFETSQRRLKELTILNEVSLASTDAVSVDELIEKITHIIGESLYPDNFGVLLLNAEGTALTPQPSYRGISVGKFPASSSLDKGVCGQVAISGKPIRLANVRNYKNYIEVTSQVRSEVCVPIAHGDRILGVINAESLKINMFTEDDERLLVTIAGTLATAIEKLRLLEAEKKRRQEAETLLDATTTLTTSLNLDTLLDKILEILSRIVSYDSASIALERDGKLLLVAGRGFPPGYEVVGKQLLYSEKWLLQSATHKPFIVPDTHLEPRFKQWEGSEYIRGWMGVPMVIHGKLKGFINLDSRKPDTFTENDAILAQTFANSVVVAIENASLFEIEQQSRHKAEALREATAALTASIDLVSLYETILDSLAKLIPFDSASIEILEGGIIKVVAGQGLRDNENCIDQQYPYDATKWGNLATLREPILISDVQEDDRFVKLEGTDYIHGWMGVPMFVQDKLVGFLNLDSSTIGFFTQDHAALAQTFGNQAAIAIENAHLFAQEQSQRQRNAILLDLMHVAASSLELDDVMHTILERLCELVPSKSGSVQLLEGAMLRVSATIGTSPESFPVGRLLPLDDFPLNRQIIEENIPVCVIDTRKSDQYKVIRGLEHVRSFLSVPLTYKNKAIGLIALDSREEAHFTTQDTELALAVAWHAAIAIENARLFQEESRRSQIIEAMANIANEFATAQEIIPALDKITHRALELLDASTVAIYLLQDDNNTIKVVTAQGTYREQLMSHTIEVGTGITGNIIATGKPEIVDDMLKDSRRIRVPGTPEEDAQRDTVMSAPLILRGKPIGAINAWRKRSSGLFNESELNFLVSIAHQTSMSIESIRLFQETARRAQEAHAIAEVGRDVSSTLQLDMVLERIAQYAKELLRAETSAVYLTNQEEPLLRAIAAIGNEAREIKNFPLLIGSGILGNIALQKSGEIVNDTLGDRRAITVEGTDVDPNEHLMGVPVLSKNQLTGLLAVWRTGEGEEFKVYELDFLSSLAQQAAVAIENARLFEAEQRHFQEAETLRQAAEAITSTLDIQQVLDSILDNLNRVIPFDSAGVFLIENNHVRLTAFKGMPVNGSVTDQLFPSDNALFLEIWQTGRPLILKDARNDPRYKKWVVDRTRGWMGVPLIARGNIIGYITIDSLKVEAYKEHDANLAMTFAHQAAVAIENARLYERGEQQIRQLTVLRDIDSAISSSFDLRITLNLLIGYATRELNADAIAILLYNSDLKSLFLYTNTGFSNNQSNTIPHIRIGEGLAGHVILHRKLVQVADLANTTEFHLAPYTTGENFKSYFGVPLISKGQIKGVMEVYTRNENYPDPDWLNFLQTLAGQAAIAIDNVQLFRNLQRSNQELILAYDTTLAGWGRALELRDKETQGHTDRVVELTLELARRIGVDGEELTHIMRGTLLHDIGKMGIPDNILHKPGPLTEEEWAVMKLHPQYAYDLMNPIPYLRQSLEIPYGHHERWDGSGYPRGLKGEDIPLAARIFAVVDIWDALLYERVYREAWPEDKVIEYLKSTAGIELDPAIVEIFLELIEEQRYENQAD